MSWAHFFWHQKGIVYLSVDDFNLPVLVVEFVAHVERHVAQVVHHVVHLAQIVLHLIFPGIIRYPVTGKKKTMSGQFS